MRRADTELAKTSFSKSRVILVSVLVVIFLTGAAIAAHVYLGDRRENARGILAVLDHIFDFVFALTLAGVLTSTGRAVCERFRLTFLSSAEEIGFSLFLGTGIVGLAVLLLGLMGWLRPVPVSL